MRDCGERGKRASRGLLVCVLLLFVLGLGASQGTATTAGRNVAVASAASSLELVKTADAETVDAGNRIGFRIDLTNHGEPPNQGRVIIENRVLPNWASGNFAFSGDLGNFSLNANTIHTGKALFPGPYTVSESEPPAHFALADLRCDDNNSTRDLLTRTATIQLDPGETVRCVFENTDPDLEPNGKGLVLVEKQAPATNNQFLEPSGATRFDGGFNVITSGSQNFLPSVNPGTHTLSEDAPTAPDEFVSLVCDDPETTYGANRSATLDVDPDEIIRCVYVNQDLSGQGAATNVALTDALPAGPDLSWSLDPAVPGCSMAGRLLSCSFGSLADGQTVSVHVTSPTTIASCGRYTNTAVARADNRNQVQATASLTVVCPTRIVVEKHTLPDGSQQLFGFSGAITASLGDGQSEGKTVAPGTYTVSEVVPGGWDASAIQCQDPSGDSSGSAVPVGPGGTASATFRAAAGETVTCTFTNTKRGRVVVDKVTNPSSDPQSFSFDASGGSYADFSLTDAATPNSQELATGKYAVSETVPSGWDLTSATCTSSIGDTETPGNIELDAGETVACTFTNTKRGSVTLKKTTNGVVDPSKDINFVLTGPGLPTAGITRSTFGDQDGVLDFGTGNLIAGQTYKICESPVPAGFTSFWKLDGVIVTPYNPDASRSPPEDLGTRCYDFSVAPAQVRAFEVDNSHPGGEPRTIGYWKNWNRCTSGNQSATAQKNGGAAAGFFLVEDLLPQLIGDFSVTTCQQAVKLLSKQDQSGKSKSSDAAYELGAQLLAARFNLAAGAETCAAVQQVLLDAQTLLDQINFTGTGDYLGSKSKDARRAQALSLAATLDRYNNGNLC